jgi:DNA-binding response OmpR family regulator
LFFASQGLTGPLNRDGLFSGVAVRQERDPLPILFVDDDAAVRQALVYIVQDRLTLLTAGCSVEALEVLRARDVAVLLGDQRMPGMSGVELCVHARALKPQLVTLITTAYMDLNMIATAMKDGNVTAYVPKPWTDRQIMDALEYAVARASHCGSAERPTGTYAISKPQPCPADGSLSSAPCTAAAILESGPFRVDLLAQRVWAGGRELCNLEPLQLRVLGCLIERAGSVWHRDELIARLYGQSSVNSRAISRAICGLRQSCDEARELIVNVRAVGYGILVPSSAQAARHRLSEFSRSLLCSGIRNFRPIE